MHKPDSIRRALALTVERLESRIAPASLVTVNAATKTASWTDFDGDLVTLKWTGATAPTFADHTPIFGVTDSTIVDTVNLTNDDDTVTVAVKTGPLGGDAHVDLGYINSFNHALKRFSAPKASVLELDCGDGAHAIGALALGSFAPLPASYFNTPGGSGLSVLLGTVGTVKITGNLGFGSLVLGNGADAATTIGTVTISGSLQGNFVTSVGGGQLVLHSAGATVKIGGSIIGGSTAHSGEIFADVSAKSIKIGGDIIGGSAINTGRIEQTVDGATVISIGGSVVGKANAGTGEIVTKAIGSIVLGGNLEGGSAALTGLLNIASATSIAVKGSVLGGAVLNPAAGADVAGAIETNGSVGTITIGHNIIVGTTTHTDANSNRVTKNGAILVVGNVGSLSIGGSVEGTEATKAFILAEGVYAGGTPFNALGKLSVKGSVRNAIIASGQDPTSDFSINMGGAEVSSAGIGNVAIGGDYYHTSLMAGTNDGGFIGVGLLFNADSQTGPATLGSIGIKGTLLDDIQSSTSSGFEASQIAKIVVGGTTVFTHSATPGQLKYLDSRHFVFAEEL